MVSLLQQQLLVCNHAPPEEGRPQMEAKPDLVGNLLLVVFVLVLPVEECDHH